jgi:antitoxin component HigA of HigAB toxin-antitoxin module
MMSMKIKRRPTVRRELKLFDYLMTTYNLRTDDDLAEFMLCSKTIVSMTRCDHRGLSPRLTLVIYDKTPLTIEEIRALAKEYV